MNKSRYQRLIFKHLTLLISYFIFSIPIHAYDFSDNQPYSQSPPGGLTPNKVPMFVSIGFDDNGISGLAGSGGTGGLNWFLDFSRSKYNPAGSSNPSTYDGTPARVTFFNTSSYQEQWKTDDPVYVKRAWHRAMTDGHEIGNHTVNHGHGSGYSLSKWNSEIGDTQVHLSKPFNANEQPGSAVSSTGMGADISKITGFRTPYLEYNDNTFSALKNIGLTYDTSIEEGEGSSMDGTNYPWPYTLDSGSPGNQSISSHAGLWELGVTPLIIPPDNQTSAYGVNHSIRDKVKSNMSFFDIASGKITAFDWNLWVEAKLDKAETLATLKYTLDLRLKNGNRAPFMLGAHTDYFSSKNENLASQITVRERQETIEEFINYALSKPEVRIVPFKSIVNWMRNPSSIDCGSNCNSSPPEIINPGDQTSLINDVINLQIQASDSNSASLLYSVANLPAGLSIDATTGLISGTLTTESNQSVTVTVDNGGLTNSTSFNWKVTTSVVTPEDPWTSIVALAFSINDLQEHSDTLELALFSGSTWQEQLASKDKISIDLSAAANECWGGKPSLAISKLNLVLSYLDQEMLPGTERTSTRNKIDEFIPQLEQLVGANF